MKKMILILVIILSIPSFIIAKEDLNQKRAEEKVLLKLKKEYEHLKLWEKRLIEQEKRLKKIELEIVANKEEIKKIQDNISSLLSEIKQIRDANISQLALVYSKMSPENAAEVVNNMPTNLAVKIFLKMKPTKVAKILNIVNRDKAISITEKLALYGINIKLRGE